MIAASLRVEASCDGLVRMRYVHANAKMVLLRHIGDRLTSSERRLLHSTRPVHLLERLYVLVVAPKEGLLWRKEERLKPLAGHVTI
jgi:hypothetical protein